MHRPFAGIFHHAPEEIHFRRADETRNKQIGRIIVEFQRRAHLLHHAGPEHNDLVGKRHGFDLVMGHIDYCRSQRLVQLCNLNAHVHAKFRIEIGQRLIKKEHVGMADNRPADSNALTLPA